RSEAFAQGKHGRRLDNIDRFDFEATRIAALQFAQIPRRTALRSNDFGVVLEPLFRHRQTQPARGAYNQNCRLRGHASLRSEGDAGDARLARGFAVPVALMAGLIRSPTVGRTMSRL